MKDDKSKEFLYTLLGGALLLKDRFSDQFDDILKKSEESKEDIKATATETMQKATSQKEEIESELKSKIKSIVGELGLATKEDIEELKELIKNQQKG
jgi:polyhydroxyalkanoate synthesis regulator phasin